MSIKPNDIPDFEQLARNILDANAPTIQRAWPNDLIASIAASLRKVWNARGKADVGVLDSMWSAQLGHQHARLPVGNSERAIQALDVEG